MSTGTLAAFNPDDEKPAPASAHGHDPDSFRMTVGEHLEELRWRLILALVGFFAAMLACLLFAEKVVSFFCAPLTRQLIKHDINPQIFYNNLTEPFMTYLKITMICAVAIAGPWIIFQIWQFIAAGLFPHERKMVTKYIPLSVTLFLGGLVFVYFVVLPLSIAFFIDFSNTFSMPLGYPSTKLVEATPYHIPVLEGDLKSPHEGDMWINSVERRIKVFFDGKARAITFGPDGLLSPMLQISVYIDLVLTFMLTFGLAFQLPLVILALVSLGIVEVTFLKKKRKMIYFAMTVSSAFLAPGDIVTSMLALLIPLIILYEFGLWLVAFSGKNKPAAVE